MAYFLVICTLRIDEFFAWSGKTINRLLELPHAGTYPSSCGLVACFVLPRLFLSLLQTQVSGLICDAFSIFNHSVGFSSIKTRSSRSSVCSWRAKTLASDIYCFAIAFTLCFGNKRHKQQIVNSALEHPILNKRIIDEAPLFSAYW